ncbi:MAG TPA: aminopeptidase P N-terminal domain-containing protein, partial [Microcella sp.]|nr:aminopeptidase P N-terminal domain-containing protein [Microcella sp.]
MADSDKATTDAPRATENRSTTPGSDRFRDFITSGWAERPAGVGEAREEAMYAASRRSRLSALFPGQRLIVPAGPAKQRSNDTDYPYRAHSAFAHLTGWASDSEPDSILVFDPTDAGHDVTLYFRERADRTTTEFYADATVGEFWIGPRPSLAGVAADLAVATQHLDRFAAAEGELVLDEDDDLTRFVSELRLVKDEFEITEMRR